MASSPPAGKRRPTVLVTDARDNRTNPRSPMVRFVSVDSVLRNSSEIPSGRPRAPNPLSHIHRSRGPPPRKVDPRRLVNPTQVLPSRTSKVSERLVLLPETEEAEGKWDYADGEDEGPMRDDEFRTSPDEDEDNEGTKKLPPRKSYAERLPKSKRAEKFSRATAYCTAESYRLKAASAFLKEVHGARTKLYDECLYVAYHLPLLPGKQGYRLHSSPALKSPGGKAVLDVEIERSERHEYREGYFESGFDRDRRASVDSNNSSDNEASETRTREEERRSHDAEQEIYDRERERERETVEQQHHEEAREQFVKAAENSNIAMSGFAEMFLFSYGVAVFWNFTEKQEKDILADLTFASTDLETKLIGGPMKEEDFETEEFHFEYSSKTRSPRIYNDMITLRSGDIMVKLAISHAIAQSTKLCRFEERMATTMTSVSHIPKSLALTGKLGLSRAEVLKMSGRLFGLRVDVNLSSNVLDNPDFFWDAEPTLYPLYSAVREYLEIKQRILVLNERCRVFLDLADILSDSIADGKMTRITWIIIVLIVLSIVVTVAEVGIRFGILSAQKRKSQAGALGGGIDDFLGIGSGGIGEL